MSVGGNRFISDATEELLTLQKIDHDIEDDILRQRNRVQRGAQQLFWTIAPAGFANRRGHSVKGPSLGPGPLPPKVLHCSLHSCLSVVQSILCFISYQLTGNRLIEKPQNRIGHSQILLGLRRPSTQTQFSRLR